MHLPLPDGSAAESLVADLSTGSLVSRGWCLLSTSKHRKAMTHSLQEIGLGEPRFLGLSAGGTGWG